MEKQSISFTCFFLYNFFLIIIQTDFRLGHNPEGIVSTIV